jgi:signal transduction histidine kinase
VAPQAREKQVTLVHERSDPKLLARGDREKIQQVVLNLLSNAVKFTNPGGTIRLACSDARADALEIRVADTGRGIPAGALEKIFQPFVQVDAQLTRTFEGTGLGLAISRDLARGMGGDLTVESEAGAGSTFTMIIPRP